MHNQSVPSLFGRLPGDLEGLPAHPPAAFRPALDLVETPEGYEIIADVPGVTREDVEVAFFDGVLEITGSRGRFEPAEGTRVVRNERRAGSFTRRIAFREDVNVASIEATVKDGVLTVSVPKSEARKARTIPVNVH